jgi:hypothetical protein
LLSTSCVASVMASGLGLRGMGFMGCWRSYVLLRSLA